MDGGYRLARIFGPYLENRYFYRRYLFGHRKEPRRGRGVPESEIPENGVTGKCGGKGNSATGDSSIHGEEKIHGEWRKFETHKNVLRQL